MESTKQGDASQDGSDDGDDRKPPAKETGGDGTDAAASSSSRSLTRKRKGKSDKSNHQLRWEEMYHRLCEYHKRCGNANVPNRYAEDPQLGSWVSAQRRAYKTITSGSTGSTAMTLERATKLKQLGFEWEALNPNNVPWDTRYNELLSFVKKYGHANVPMRWKENVQLSNWVSKQRHDYKLLQRGTSSRLTEQRKKLLNDVGFIWEVERGSSIAQLQRVSVVGLPTRKTRRAESDTSSGVAAAALNVAAAALNVETPTSNTVSRSSSSQQQSQAGANEQQQAAAVGTEGSGSVASAPTSLDFGGAASSIGSEVATLAASAAGHIQMLGSPSPLSRNNSQQSQRLMGTGSGITIGETADQQTAPRSAHGGTTLGSLQALQLAQGAIRNTGLHPSPGGSSAFASLQGATSPHQAQNPMVILPILAMMPQLTQGTAGAAGNPQAMLHAPNNTANMTALATLLGGNSSPLNAVAIATLLGGGGANTAAPMGAAPAAVPSNVPTTAPAPNAVANLQASLVALASALGTAQQPHAPVPMRHPSVALPVAMNPNQANLASLTSILGAGAGASTHAQQLAASTLASVFAGGVNPFAAPAAPFAAPAAAPFAAPVAPVAPQQNDVAGALASTLSRFFDTTAPAPQPQQPPPPPLPAPTDSAQNLAAALSQFFQTNPQTQSTTTHQRQDPDGNHDGEEDEPPEKRARRS